MMRLNFRRLYVCSLMVFGCIGQLVAAEPTISVAVQPRYPWNGNVDVKFTITGDSGTKYDTSFTAKDVAGGTNLTMKTLYKSNGTAANVAKELLLPGTYNWVWDATADLGEGKVLERVVVEGKTVLPYWYVKFNANGGTGTMANEEFNDGVAKELTANAFTRTGYVFSGWATSTSGAVTYTDKQSVTDLTTGGETVNLYAIWKSAVYMVVDLSSGGISYMDAVPSGGWSSTYKTTKLVLRKIPNKSFWLGIFELTQRQYTILGLANPSLRGSNVTPVNSVEYENCRDYVAKLNQKTGKMGFRQPTASQWLAAAEYGGGGYKFDQFAIDSYEVGLYVVNLIGIYDMQGNVCERVTVGDHNGYIIGACFHDAAPGYSEWKTPVINWGNHWTIGFRVLYQE